MRRELEFSMRDDLPLTGEKCTESLFIEIQRPNEKKHSNRDVILSSRPECAGFCWQRRSVSLQNLERK